MIADTRSLEAFLLRDLSRKCVLLSGPRQVGKTTLAKKIIKEKKGRYLLYDNEEDRRVILARGYVQDFWVCLDEFHKFPRWKAHIKGVYDKYRDSLHLLLTGSARLDVYQKSGDSLLGRYYLHHLHPLTFGELNKDRFPPLPDGFFEVHESFSHLAELMKFGGFPEPFYSQSETEHRRWSQMRRQLLIREDLRDMTQIQLLALVEQLMLILPERIGSLFSFHSLSEDLRVSVPTVQNWMEALKRLFIIFDLTPYSHKISRSLKKQPKYYFYDWSQISDEGSRFENLVASHLWKAVQQWTDLGYASLGLHFVRDRDQREVDFLVTRNRKPWFLVEAKLAETQFSPSLKFYSQKLNVPGLQIVLKEGHYRREDPLLLVSANRWLGFLP